MAEAAGSVLELGSELTSEELERLFAADGPASNLPERGGAEDTSDTAEVDHHGEPGEGANDLPSADNELTVISRSAREGRRHNTGRRRRLTPRNVLAGFGAAAMLATGTVACGLGPHVTQRTFSGTSVRHAAEHVAGVAVRAPFDVGHAACLSFFLLIGSLPKWSGDEQWADGICGSYVTISNPAGNSSPDVSFGASPGLGSVLNAMIAKANFNGPGMTGYYFDTNSTVKGTKECTLVIIAGPKGSRKHPIPPSFVVLARDTGSGWQKKPVIAFADSPTADAVRAQLDC